MKFVLFAFLLAAALVAVIAKPAPQESYAQDTCSPWLGLCQTTDDCCRHLICAHYQAKCVPRGGLVIPGRDTRPVGPGPFPPGYIE